MVGMGVMLAVGVTVGGSVGARVDVCVAVGESVGKGIGVVVAGTVPHAERRNAMARKIERYFTPGHECPGSGLKSLRD
jgi:hypothetical protein